MRAFSNFGEETLSVGIGSGDTTVSLVADASLPASGHFFAPIFNSTDYSDPGDDPDVEMLEVSGTGTSRTIKRAQQGTTAKAHNTAGKTYKIRCVWSRTDAERSEKRFDIRDEGAVDGAADVTSAFSAAVDAAVAANGHVYIPEGTWTIDTKVLTKDWNLRIRGEGRLSILKHKDSATGPLLDCSSFTAGDTLKHFELVDVAIDGNKANLGSRTIATIDLRAKDMRIARCEIYNTVKASVRIRHLTGLGAIRECVFRDAALHSGVAGEDSGFILVGKDAAALESMLLVADNKFTMPTPTAAGDSAYGIVANCAHEQHVRVVGNTMRYLGQDIAGNISSPIHGYDSARMDVVGNTIRDSCLTPIHVQRTDDANIDNNTIVGESNWTTANNVGVIRMSGRVTVQTQRRANITNNRISGLTSATYAISLAFDATANGRDFYVAGNHCHDTEGGLLLDYVSGSCVVVGNSFEDLSGPSVARTGIRLDDVDDNLNLVVSKNTFRNVERKAIDLSPPTLQNVHAVVTENIFDGVAETSLDYAIDVANLDTLVIRDNVAVNLPGAAELVVIGTITNLFGELEGSKTWDPGSVSDGAMTSTTVTVTKAVAGDIVACSHDQLATAGVILFAAVTAADTVTVTLVNHSGGPFDLSSGTLKARVQRPILAKT